MTKETEFKLLIIIIGAILTVWLILFLDNTVGVSNTVMLEMKDMCFRSANTPQALKECYKEIGYIK